MIERQQLAGGSCTPDTFNANPHMTKAILDLFFAGEDDPEAQAEAKALCADCPRQTDCLDIGMSEPDGIWGGLTTPERKRLP